MLDGEYDYLFVTHLPAFYKVNLYNAIAKHCRVYVIFIAPGSNIRAPDFTTGEYHFDYCYLNHGSFEKRVAVHSLWRLFWLTRKLRYQRLVVGGWDLIEFWFLAFFSHKAKNGLALESSIFESKTHGLVAALKKLFLSRLSIVFPSGEPQQGLLYALNFMGRIKKTMGVGIFQYQKQIPDANTFAFEGKFLYVGRLSPEKNLPLLLQVFAHLPQFSLTLIGDGPQQTQLQKMATANVRFAGYVLNEALAQWYQEHDVLILPSLKEPWGLVVEEALHYGLPVIVSNRVGCAKDIVERLQVGLLFDPQVPLSLHEAINMMMEHYDKFLQKVHKMDFHSRDHWQVQQYVQDFA